MKFVAQNLEDVLASLSPLDVAWEDDTSKKVVALLQEIPSKSEFDREDLRGLLESDFDNGLLVVRLFLGFSRDKFTAALKDAADGPAGITRFRKEPDIILEALVHLGVLDAMTQEVNRKLTWKDILIERLRFGRGSAVSGIRRGREVEDFVEGIVQEVFGDSYDIRCNFGGVNQRTAKCDFAIPNRQTPWIVIEAKGYGATGSKQTDILGDIEKIVSALRRDQHFIFFTDGLTWNARQSDLRRIVEHQNQGNILRIYTYQMAEQLRQDLIQLKNEQSL